MMSSITSAAALSRAFGGDYLSEFVDLPTVLVGLGIVVLIALINFRGIGESAKVNVVFTLIELGGLILVVIIGVAFLAGGDGDPGRALEFKENSDSVPFLILAGASFLSVAMAYTGIPRELAAWVEGLDLSPYVLIAALTLMYMVLGTALDGISMIVLTTAVVLPMVRAAGFDLVWFGIFMVLVIEMAEVSPPVGFNLFVLQAMSGKDSLTVARAALPFFGLLVAAVAIVTVFPGLVMALPRWAFPG